MYSKDSFFAELIRIAIYVTCLLCVLSCSTVICPEETLEQIIGITVLAVFLLVFIYLKTHK